MSFFIQDGFKRVNYKNAAGQVATQVPVWLGISSLSQEKWAIQQRAAMVRFPINFADYPEIANDRIVGFNISLQGFEKLIPGGIAGVILDNTYNPVPAIGPGGTAANQRIGVQFPDSDVCVYAQNQFIAHFPVETNNYLFTVWVFVRGSPTGAPSLFTIGNMVGCQVMVTNLRLTHFTCTPE